MPAAPDVIPSLLSAVIEGRSSALVMRFREALKGDGSEEELHDLVRVARTPKEKGVAYLLLAQHYLKHRQWERVFEGCQQARQAWPEAGLRARCIEAVALGSSRDYENAFSAFGECAEALAQSQRTGKWEGPAWSEASLDSFYGTWVWVGVGQGVEGLLAANLAAFETGGDKVIRVLRAARASGHESAVWGLLDDFVTQLPQWAEQVEELRLYVRLMSIEDPFEGWRALGEEISKVWPKGVSAVDAIREQRE